MKGKKIGKMLVLAFVVLVVTLMPVSMGADVIGNSNSPNNLAGVIASNNNNLNVNNNNFLNNVADVTAVNNYNNNLNTNNNNLNVNNNDNVNNNLNVNNDNVENNFHNNVANFFNNLRNTYPIFNWFCNMLSNLIY